MRKQSDHHNDAPLRDAAGTRDAARPHRGVHAALWIAGAGGIGALAYAYLIRPWHLRWGATREESVAALPGDDLIDHPRLQSTRAIIINAPASEIWPWLAQMGQGRGGLYSYDWLENLIGCDIHSLDHIDQKLQFLRPGDMVRLGPKGYPFFTVVSVHPDDALVLAAGFDPNDSSGAASHNRSTWAFVLRPIDKRTTRLIVRLRGAWEPAVAMDLFNRVFLEPVQFIMERKMIHGIRDRAERSGE